MPHFDLIIVGSGSGNSIPGPDFENWNIAIVEDGLFGGTCLNVGCIPTKMFVYPAELADASRHAAHLNVTSHLDAVDWPTMRDRIFGRIDAIEAGGRQYRDGAGSPNVTVFAGRGVFTGHKALHVDLHDGSSAELTADRFVLAAGSSATVPNIPGLSDGSVPFHTSDTIMRIDDLPASMLILGGGYIAAEFAHVFSSFGVQVTQLVRGNRLLKSHDDDISEAFTAEASARYEVVLGVVPDHIVTTDSGIAATFASASGPRTVEAQVLLVATGRYPNGRKLGVTATGVELHDDGRVVVDEFQRTTVEGIYAMGDISTEHQLKHVANQEARVVKHNLAHPDALRTSDHRFVPAAVFTHPQIASVGLTESQARDQGFDYAVKRQDYGDIAAGWAREDSGHFLKVLSDKKTGLLLGAHVIGPEAATVIQPLIQAMSFSQLPHDVARGQYWIHPALSELVENALLGLPAPTGR